MTRSLPRDNGAGTSLLPPIFARRGRIATYLPRPTAEQSARRAVLADIIAGRAVTPADVRESERRHGLRPTCDACGAPGTRTDRPDILPHDCPRAPGATYPRRTDDGRTVYACCVSAIGPICAHLSAPVTDAADAS